MSDRSFVRTKMLEEKAPPTSQVGIIKWLGENLFSSVFNTVLTIAVLFMMFTVLSEILPWVFQSSWNASSLRECRANIEEAYGEGTHGACWAVIHERYRQLIYGFYPVELRWRINLAFILMFVAISPILFTQVPRKLIWFSAVYPLISLFLLWGGSVWFPLMILLGFVIGYLAFVFIGKTSNSLLAVIGSCLLPLIWWFVLAGPISDYLYGILPWGIEAVESRLFGGFSLSILIGVTGIGLSLPIGIVLALGRQSNLFIIKILCVIFIEFIRGVPLITLLFVASTLLNYFLPKGTNFDIIMRVIIMVTLFASAYMAEVIRGGLAALPKGQYEGADSLGLDFWQATRLVIMPQALKISIPSIVSTFIGLFKDTTLVSIINMLDPIGLTRTILADQNWNGIIWELYVAIGVVFWVFCFSMSRYSMYLERKLQTSH